MFFAGLAGLLCFLFFRIGPGHGFSFTSIFAFAFALASNGICMLTQTSPNKY